MNTELCEKIKKAAASADFVCEAAGRNDFSHTAVSMNFYLDEERPIGTVMLEYDFTEEFINNNPEDCFVIVMLTDVSVSSGSGSDPFRGQNPEERMKLIRNRYHKELFASLDIREIAYEELEEQFSMFSEYGGMSEGMIDYYLDIWKNAFILETGGKDSTDHDYFIISGSRIYSVNCGMG